jgi:tetratricopeptide (TPR) repeat protein
MSLWDWFRRRPGTSTQNIEKALLHRLRGAAADIQLKNFKVAQEVLLEIVKHRAQLSDPLLIRGALQNLGATWYLQDIYQPGIEFFSGYIGQYPTDAHAYSQRGTLFWHLGRNQDALQDFSHALELLPDDFFSLLCRGQVFAELEESDDALGDFDKASKWLDEYSAWDLEWRRRSQAYIDNGRGFALAKKGHFESALKSFDNSVSLWPNNAWVYYNRARAYDARGERVKAISDYRLALAKRDPKLPVHMRELAESRLNQ